MAYRIRLKYTDEMKSYIWDGYQNGDAIKAIARALDRPSSSIHRQLAKAIVENGGALVSEYPFGVEAQRAFFVARDRIQAGLSMVTMVLQSGIDGGSLHAARACVRYGRPLIFVSPSSVDLEESPDLVGANRIATSGDFFAAGEMLKAPSDIVAELLVPLSSKDDYDIVEKKLFGKSEKISEQLF